MKANDERKLTFDEEVEALLKTMVRLKPKLKPKPQPKLAAQKAEERWSDKPFAAVLQDAQRADAAATDGESEKSSLLNVEESRAKG